MKLIYFTIFFLSFLIISNYSVAEIELAVKWDNPERSSVLIEVTKHDARMEECRQSGAEVYYRYESEICIRRKSWGENCKKVLINTRTLSVDPISETYSVVSDRWGDDVPAEKNSYTEFSEALVALSRVHSVPIDLDETERRRQFMNVRVRFICKGQSSALLTRLSQIVTLGIAPAEGIDSGWQEFDFPKN